MLKILLICSAGMSTGIMVEQMKKSAKEKSLDVKIWAVAEPNALENIKEADVILVGPQLRFKLGQIKEICGSKPADVIDMRDYGMMNGKSVLEFAYHLANKDI